MTRIASIVSVLILVSAAPTVAQDHVPLQLRTLSDGVQQSDDGPRPVSGTHILMQRPEWRQALDEFQHLKAQGKIPFAARKTASPPEIGDQQTFKVVSFSTNEQEDIEFELKVKEPRFHIWVEIAELDNGNVSDDALEQLRLNLADQTPEGSFRPDRGIIENDELIFGSPPNVDQDGITDVLIVDVRDDYDPSQGNNNFIGGFFSPADLTSSGNMRDIVYLDTHPSLTSPGLPSDLLQLTAAHEYQHLIHAGFDENETNFVNEAQSEWAEIINGFPGRNITFLASPERYNVSFINFADDVSLDDRQRGLLFTSYLEQRIGRAQVGLVTRQRENAVTGYRTVLNENSLSFRNVLVDFHTANLINDRSIDERFGYERAQFQGLKATPTLRVDARTQAETPNTIATLRSGGVQYLVWEHVTDLNLALDAFDQTLRSRFRARAFLFNDGTVEVQDLTLDSATKTFEGDYDRVAVVVAHGSPDLSAAEIEYSATWNVEQTFASETVSYDDGQAVEPFVGAGNAELVTQFTNPQPGSGILSSVRLPLYFFSQFGNDDAPPEDAPRDFTLTVREATAEGTPGDTIVTATLDDSRSYQPVTSLSLRFLEVDLADYVEQLSDLPETIFIGYRNAGATDDAGDDVNALVIAMANFTQENLSFLGPRQDDSWLPLWDAELSDGTLLEDRIVPIRATFLVPAEPTPTDDVAEIPDRVTLHENYPNPFNPSTTIRYELPQATPVTLSVYDLLGRQIATLVEAWQPAGVHEVRVDAANWTSGIYFYRLETADQTRTQKMTLIK